MIKVVEVDGDTVTLKVKIGREFSIKRLEQNVRNYFIERNAATLSLFDLQDDEIYSLYLKIAELSKQKRLAKLEIEESIKGNFGKLLDNKEAPCKTGVNKFDDMLKEIERKNKEEGFLP